MRVVHVVRQFSPSVGGLEDAVLNLASLQRRQLGIDTRVVTLDRVFRQPGRLAALDEVAGVPVRRLPWRGSMRYPVAPGVLGALGDADLVHVHAIDFFFDFLAATRPVHRKRMVASTHGGFFHSSFASKAKRVWFGAVTRASCLAYDRIIACSENDAAMFRPIAGSRLVTIENGIDAGKFADASSPSPSRTIVCFGRFARHKRVHLLFPLLASLRTLHPDWRLIVAGSDSDTNEVELREAAAASRVSDAVRFAISPSDAVLRALIGEASWYASASAHEGYGIAAVEAMSAGLVPVLSDIAPFRRLVERTGIGMVADFEALDALGAEMERMAGTLDAGVREAAMRSVTGLDWLGVSARYELEYEAVMGTAAGSPAIAGMQS